MYTSQGPNLKVIEEITSDLNSDKREPIPSRHLCTLSALLIWLSTTSNIGVLISNPYLSFLGTVQFERVSCVLSNHTLLPMPAKMLFMTINLTVSKLTASQQHSTSAGGQISTVLFVPYDTLNFKPSNSYFTALHWEWYTWCCNSTSPLFKIIKSHLLNGTILYTIQLTPAYRHGYGKYCLSVTRVPLSC